MAGKAPNHEALVVHEREQLGGMTDRALVAYWNILQFETRTIFVGDREKSRRHGEIVSDLLTARGIAHEAGKLTKAAA